MCKHKLCYINTCPNYIANNTHEKFVGVLSHEFGHVFGLSDAYADSNHNKNYHKVKLEPIENQDELYYNLSIKNGTKNAGLIMKREGSASLNDIEMILHGACSGERWQYFTPTHKDDIGKNLDGSDKAPCHYISPAIKGTKEGKDYVVRYQRPKYDKQYAYDPYDKNKIPFDDGSIKTYEVFEFYIYKINKNDLQEEENKTIYVLKK